MLLVPWVTGFDITVCRPERAFTSARYHQLEEGMVEVPDGELGWPNATRLDPLPPGASFVGTEALFSSH
ncbi:MAG: hypothetical protein JRI68_01850 [Deltaproteobacteria bacterium]|nr:hypothetical protein [Deltaproteobacteria bacterium]